MSRRQLGALGFSAHGIAERVRTGRLIPCGVHAVGHDRLTSQGQWLAAVIACGRGAVLSHLAAAQLWEIRQSSAAVTDVTVPSRTGRISRPGIRVHRSGRLAKEETTTRHAIPVTTIARTLLDLADVIDDQALRRTVTEAEYRHLFDLTTLNAVVQANPGRRRAKLMRAVEAAGHRTRSPLEDRFVRFKERWDVEEPETNVLLEGYEVDFLWRRVGLVVELDGLDEHGTRAAVRRDRTRTASCGEQGLGRSG